MFLLLLLSSIHSVRTSGPPVALILDRIPNWILTHHAVLPCIYSTGEREKERKKDETGKTSGKKNSKSKEREADRESGGDTTAAAAERQKNVLAIVEFGSRPQGRLIPHRQFINNTLVLVDIRDSFPFTDPPTVSSLSLSLYSTIRYHPGNPSIHPSPGQAGTILGVIPELSRVISFFTFSSVKLMWGSSDAPYRKIFVPPSLMHAVVVPTNTYTFGW